MKRSKVYEIRSKIEAAASLQTDESALDSKWMFPEWATDTAYAIGNRVRYVEKLYKCNIAHTSQDDWKPDTQSALWSEVSIEEWAEWKQPTGAHDAYNIGDKVSYNGKHYICDINGNVYAPDVYGWHEV